MRKIKLKFISFQSIQGKSDELLLEGLFKAHNI